jgi:hypothetical protein
LTAFQSGALCIRSIVHPVRRVERRTIPLSSIVPHTSLFTRQISQKGKIILDKWMVSKYNWLVRWRKNLVSIKLISLISSEQKGAIAQTEAT